MEGLKQTILVIGATGNQGGTVARHLLQRGNFTVRLLVRDPNKPAAQALNPMTRRKQPNFGSPAEN